MRKSSLSWADLEGWGQGPGKSQVAIGYFRSDMDPS